MYPVPQNAWDRYRESILDVGLNVAVLTIANCVLPGGFDVSETAPATYAELCEHFLSGKRLVVYSGGSDRTIFGDPEVNYHFRAWHDWCHWTGRHDFSVRGEYAVFEMQCTHLVQRYGQTEQTTRWRDILFADGMGQQAYSKKHGHFPGDQMAFVKAFLEAPPRDLLDLIEAA